MNQSSLPANAANIVKKALNKIQELSAENLRLKSKIVDNFEPIAIIGVSCRFPENINTMHDLWETLDKEQDVISQKHRKDFQKNILRNGGFLTAPFDFDRKFFRISKKEAKSLDPQQRLLLEVTWEALEDACIVPSTLAGTNTSVFIGIGTDDYSQLMVRDNVVGSYFASGNSHSTAAGRLSYFLDLNGPALSIDTACSSALVAVHLACSALRNNETDLAIVGAANSLLNDLYHENFEAAGMLSKDGLCKVFDKSADGYVRSEGCAVIILKPFKQAKLDGDPIWGIIKGSAVNQDGQSSGLTVPNRLQQENLIKQALLSSKIDFEDIAFIETHGTGTALGDPIEINAISNLCEEFDRKRPLYLTGVKANLGHLEPAAGMAGLLKALLCLKNNSIPRQIHFDSLNPKINWKKELIIPKSAVRLVDSNLKAGVSAFGFSGTNAHVVLESFDNNINYTENDDEFILRLTGKTLNVLKNQINQFYKFIKAADKNQIANICYTANCFREIFSYRVVFIFRNILDLGKLIDEFMINPSHSVLVAENINNENLIKNIISGQWDAKEHYQQKKCHKVHGPTYAFEREYLHFLDQRQNDYLYEQEWVEVSTSKLNLTQEENYYFCQHDRDSLKGILNNIKEEDSVNIIYSVDATFSEIEQVCELVDLVHILVETNKKVKVWLLTNQAKNKSSQIFAQTGAFASLKLEYPTIFYGHLIVENDLEKNELYNLFMLAQHYKVLKQVNSAYYAPRLIRVVPSTRGNVFLFSAQDVYVIMGGSGGIGQVLMRWLLEDKKVKAVALISRHLPSSPIPSGVKHYVCDITVKENLFSTLNIIHNELGHITGVFNASGINEYYPARMLNPDIVKTIMMPKITAAHFIVEYFKNYKTDFIIHCGSIAAVWGVNGMVPYCAANAAIEALCSEHQNHYIIHFGPWENVGMAKRADIERNGVLPLLSSTALEAFEAVLCQKKNLIATNIDWNRFISLYYAVWKNHFFDEFDSSFVGELEFEAQSKGPLTRKIIINELENILGSDIGEEDLMLPLAELGIDSIMAVDFSQKLQRYVEEKIPSTLIYDFPTLEKICERFLSQKQALYDDAQYKKNKSIERIAIIGVSCRVNTCQEPNNFWKDLLEKKVFVNSDSQREFFERVGEQFPEFTSKAANLINQPTHFDCSAFRLSPTEAQLMDPQQRVLLECAWEAIESANMTLEGIAQRKCGVFIGVSNNDYANLCRKYMKDDELLLFPTSQALNMIAGRIAYFYSLNGPSLAVDTACSSSLMAIHLACQSIHCGESELALAGGVNMIFDLQSTTCLTKANMLSKTGRCSPFDFSADGYVRAEGAGLLLLKPLSKAIEDGDNIIGIIEGSAANQDGKSASITAPSSAAQISVMQQALSNAEINASEISFVEAHGTGTELGDAIEWQSIGTVFAAHQSHLAVSSIKANVGHAESASGILSVINTLGRVRSGYIAPQVHFKNMNPHVRDNGPLFIPTEPIQYFDKQRVVALVNSFGFSGTNVSVVIGSYNTSPDFLYNPFPKIKSIFDREKQSIVPEIKTSYKEKSLYVIEERAAHLEKKYFQSILSFNIDTDNLDITPISTDSYDSALPSLNHYCVEIFQQALKNDSSYHPTYENYVKLMNKHCTSLQNKNAVIAAEDLKLFENECRLINNIAPQLNQVLLGNIAPTSVLFPDGSDDLVISVYQNSIKSKQINQFLGEMLRKLVGKVKNIDKKLQILEVGAGTGSTTVSVLNALEDISYDYLYTDISSYLLENAKSRFSKYDAIDYQVFDLDSMDKMPISLYQKFDIIVAANVIHATKNISKTLKILNSCLNSNGILLIFEGTKEIPWIDFIFGLTSGWWAFDDERKDHPLISGLQWKYELEKCGFTSRVFEPDSVSGQVVVLGQKKYQIDIPNKPKFYILTEDTAKNEWADAADTYKFEVIFSNLTDEFNLSSEADGIFYHCRLASPSAEAYQFLEFIRNLQNTPFANLPLYIVGQNTPETDVISGIAQVALLEYRQQVIYVIQSNQDKPSEYFNELYSTKPLSQITLRDGVRYSKYLASVDSTTLNVERIVIKRGGWLISGGQGGLGLEVSAYLIQKGAPYVVLLGRSDSMHQKAKDFLKGITTDYERQIIYRSINVANNETINVLTEELRKNYCDLVGIMHLAGVVEDHLINEMTFEQFTAVFDAKVSGTLNLINLARTLNIKYFIAFSTATAILGNYGQSNHAAANAYMDAYIKKHKEFFDVVLTINWGPWSQTGAVNQEVLAKVIEKGITPFSSDEAISYLDKILSLNYDQIMAITVDWNRFSTNWRYQTLYKDFWPHQPFSQNNNNTSKLFDLDTIKTQVYSIFSSKLKIPKEELNDKKGFSVYGVDSLLSIVLTTELSKTFNKKFSSTLLFDYPTLYSLINFIAGQSTSEANIKSALRELIGQAEDEFELI